MLSRNRIIRNFNFVCVVVILAFSVGWSTDEGTKNNQENNSSKTGCIEDRIYHLILVWIKDHDKFDEYKNKVKSLGANHGVDIERVIRAQEIWTVGTDTQASKSKFNIEKPDMVYVIYFDNREAEMDMAMDSEFREIVPQWEDAMNIAIVSAKAVDGAPLDSNTNDRVYAIEFVYLKNGDADARKETRKVSNSVLLRDRHDIERTLRPTFAYGLALPDLINIIYYQTWNATAHTRKNEIESLYIESVEICGWIIGKAMTDLY